MNKVRNKVKGEVIWLIKAKPWRQMMHLAMIGRFDVNPVLLSCVFVVPGLKEKFLIARGC